MRTLFALIALTTAAAASARQAAPPPAPGASPLAGVWAFNRSLSEVRSDVGFNVPWMPTPGGGNARGRGGSGGGRGSGGNGTAAPNMPRPGEYDEAPQVRMLTDDVRNPPMRLTIAQADGAVTFTNEAGQSRTLRLTGAIDSIEIQGVSVSVTAGRVGDQLIVNYHLPQNREIRYAYAMTSNPRQLIVDVQFLERGVGDRARLVYDPGAATEAIAPTTSAAAASSAPGAPGSPTAAVTAVDQRPGAELRGLRRLGVVVEDLSTQSAACGLNRATIETAITNRLTAGGFTVPRNSDDDTYLYVNIATNMLPGGLCVSRYDAFLYTHATAQLSYRDQRVLAQVSLAHRGGMASGTPAANGTEVVRALEGYTDLFVAQIRDANK
jgi:hypothetical protein